MEQFQKQIKKVKPIKDTVQKPPGDGCIPMK
jgi:hypothetical protein